MYRLTEKSRKKFSAMGKASAKARREKLIENAEPRAAPIPERRKRIIVEIYDSGEPEKHVFELKKGRRIDMYNVYVDGKFWKHCGLSATLAGIRKAMPRILAELQ